MVTLQDAEVLAAPDPAALVTTKLAGAPWDAEVSLACLPSSSRKPPWPVWMLE